MASHVYLLRHRTQPRIKIGKADDIKRRLRCIAGRSWYVPESFDIARSVGLRVESPSAALRLERELHRRLAEWRMTAEEVAQQSGQPNDPNSGAGEWFRDGCEAVLVQFLTENKEALGFEGVEITVSRRPAGSESSVGISVQLDQALYLRLRAMAAAKHLTNSAIGAEALDAYLAAHGY